MEAARDIDQAQPDEGAEAGTLGDVLYGGEPKNVELEQAWVALVRAVAAGDELALHRLYDRTHRVVFTLVMRICADRATAEEVTVDVFHDLWRRAGGYDPANGTVLGWIMNQARSRAIDRVRFEQRKKRVDPLAKEANAVAAICVSPDAVELRQQGEALQASLAVLTAKEREAIEAAFFGELTYEEVATRLHEPLGTVKTRIRSALQKLRQALAPQGRA